MKFNENNAPDEIVFEGVKFRRMGGKRKYYLSTSTTNAGRKKPKGLHVAVWEKQNGQKVPDGHEVHHRNGDTFDFSDNNLECLPMSVHRRLPKRVDVELRRTNLLKGLSAAAAWHKSSEGREWHRQVSAKHLKKARAAVRIGDDRPVVANIKCYWCGAEFEQRYLKRKFCGISCVSKESKFRSGKRKTPHPHYVAHIQSRSASD